MSTASAMPSTTARSVNCGAGTVLSRSGSGAAALMWIVSPVRSDDRQRCPSRWRLLRIGVLGFNGASAQYGRKQDATLIEQVHGQRHRGLREHVRWREYRGHDEHADE